MVGIRVQWQWDSVMAAARQIVELVIGRKELAALRSIARSRSEPAARVERACVMLAYRDNP